MPDLKTGTHGADIRRLQLLLNSALNPSPELVLDGVYGEETRSAVMRFQRLKGLVVDGVAGPKTLAALDEPGGGPPWMAVAEAELGVHENASPGEHNQRIIEYHDTTTLKAREDEVPWCSSFVNWALQKAGYAGTRSAAAASWLKWGHDLGAEPRPGAVTVICKKSAGADAATGSFSGYHVAFYVSSTPTHVRLLGGNQSDSVKYSNFALAAYEVKAYRWPS
jgi:uncharacterized protein (TIGR02594 family)